VYQVNRPEVIDEQFDEEYVLVNLKTGVYYSLDTTAARFWDAIKQSSSKSAILSSLQETFDAEPITIQENLERLVGEMLEEELLVVANNPPPSTPDESVPMPSGHIAFSPPRIEKYTDMQALLLLDPIHQVDASGWPTTRPNVN
jgi:hypothetical protein